MKRTHVLLACMCATIAAPAQQAPADSLYQNETYNAPYRAMVAAYDTQDSAAIAAVYAQAAVYARPNGPLVGQEAITIHLGGYLAQLKKSGLTQRLAFSLLHRSVTMGVVTDVGVYRLETIGPDRSGVGYGKFVTQSILEGGAHRFALDTDRPLPPAEGAALFKKGVVLDVE